VDFSEAFQRIVRGHWLILTVCVVLGVSVGVALGLNDASSYTASTRIALGSTTPQTEGEAAAIASVAQAIATSNSQVRHALDTASVRRNASMVASNNVTVRALGTSNVVQLDVRDRNAVVAQKIANSLASEVERTWLGIGHGQTPQVVDDLNQRLNDLNQKIASLDSQINSVVDPGKGTDPVRTLLARREDLARQAVALESERDRVVSQDALDVRASIIERAILPTSADTPGRAQSIFLGGLVGLLVGLALAALVEALRPTLIGPRRIATSTGSALLGRLDRLPRSVDDHVAGVPDIATRIALAGSVARVTSIELVAASPADLGPLQVMLASEYKDPDVASGESVPGSPNGWPQNGALDRSAEDRGPTIRVAHRGRPTGGRSAGLVVVSPTRVSASALDEVADLAAISGWPVLGVVTYEPHGFDRRAAKRQRSRRDAQEDADRTSDNNVERHGQPRTAENVPAVGGTDEGAAS
jgi:capsular polysaccharide biosynthesis protein